MLELWNRFCLTVVDFLLGWLLYLPSDVVLFAVAIGSALILACVRWFTTDQDLLRRAGADKKRLNQLIRAARTEKDLEAVRRFRTTRTRVALKALKAEGWPLVATLPPIAILATWCVLRLGFHPPQADEWVELRLYTRVSAAGDVAHVVPHEGLRERGGWVQKLKAGDYHGQPCSAATWKLAGVPRPESYRVRIRHGNETYIVPLQIGGRTYSAPQVVHGDKTLTELRLRPLKLFGVVPGVHPTYFPPWLVAYLLIVIPSVFIVKRGLKIY